MNIPTDYISILLIILIVIVLILTGFVIYLNKKLKKFLIGSSSTNLDDSIKNIHKSITELEKFRIDLEKYLTSVEKRIKKSVQAIQTIRFNPFKGNGSGGNQSFATTFLSEENDGVVISSLYSRENVSVYSKPIKNGSSEYELSDEEKESVEEAKKIIKN